MALTAINQQGGELLMGNVECLASRHFPACTSAGMVHVEAS